MKLPRCLAVFALALLPLTAQADPFSEFRIPDHSWRSGTLGASITGLWLSDGASNTQSRQSAFQGAVQPRLILARDSDPLLATTSFTFSGTGTVTDSHSMTDLGSTIATDDFHDQHWAEAWQFDGQVRAYPWEEPIGLQVETSAFGSTVQDWNRSFDRFLDLGSPVLRQELSTRRDEHDYEYLLTLDAAAGFGRVRDATVVQDVRVLEDRLRETGALARPLSPQAREKLAALYYVSPFFSNAHDRPSRYFWQDVENVLRDDGALNDKGLDAYNVLRIGEGYFYRVLRQRGWFLGPVVSASHLHQGARADLRQTNDVFLDDSLVFASQRWQAASDVTSIDEVDLGGTAEYHRPLGWHWQLDLSSRVTAPVRPGDFGLHATSEAALSWLVADRWLAMADLAHSRDYFERRGATEFERNDWMFDGILQLGWYVEDHTQLTASVRQLQERRTVLPSPVREFTRITQLRVGLSYRFLGGLDAPGLIEPVRPMRWK